jgi:hypothetical protein
MAIATDFTVTVTGDIRHVANTNHYTVLELHRWLQDLADDDFVAVAGDVVDITSLTPSERATDSIITLINGFNIDDDAAEYFYAGSVTQDGGDTVYSGLKVLGAVNDTTNTQLMIIQDDDYYQYTTTDTAPYWGTQSSGGYNGDAAGGILMRVMLKSRMNGCNIDNQNIRIQARDWGDSYDFFNVTLGDGEAVGAIGTTPDAQNDTAIGTVQAWAGGDIPTNTEGYQAIDINNGSGDKYYYSKWTYNTNAAAMKAVYEWIKEITGNDSPEAATPHGRNGETFLGITHSWDYNNGAAFTEDETLVWGTGVTYDTLAGGTFTEGNYVTFGTSGAAGRIGYDNGTVLMNVAVEDTSVTIVDTEVITEYNVVTGSATGVTAAVDTSTPVADNDKNGGTGVLLAGTGTTTGTSWIQLLTGAAPVNGLEIRGITSTSTGDVNGSVSIKTIPKIFLGSYTGSLIGAYGIGIDAGDLVSTDSVLPLIGGTETPPNNQDFDVNGGEIGEDYILVGKKHASNPDYDWDEMTLATTLNASGQTQVDVGSGNIPADAPSSGTIRVELDDGRHRKIAYTSISGTQQYFETASTDWTDPLDATAGVGVMVSFLDTLCDADPQTVTIKYNAGRTFWCRARDGGGTPIKTSEGSATFGTTGGSYTISRISDA